MTREEEADVMNIKDILKNHSKCHRQDGIDPLANFCRYCGAIINKEYQVKEAISYLEALKVVLRRDHYKIDERNINSIINLLKEMM